MRFRLQPYQDEGIEMYLDPKNGATSVIIKIIRASVGIIDSHDRPRIRELSHVGGVKTLIHL